jgi:hypothetical protein
MTRKATRLHVGDHVSHDAHPDWGSGTVTRVSPSGEDEMEDGSVLAYHPNSEAAVVAIRFDDGRTRNLWDTDSQLKATVRTALDKRQQRK